MAGTLLAFAALALNAGAARAAVDARTANALLSQQMVVHIPCATIDM